MPLPTIPSGNVASATASLDIVTNSCRFNDDDSAAMSRDQSANSAGTNTKGTLSVWLKISASGTEQVIYARETDASNYFKVWFESEKLLIQTVTSGSIAMKYETNRVFRDPSAWINIIIILDSTDGSAGDRQQIWINGTRETSFATSTNIGSSANLQINTGTGTDYIGRRGSGNYYDGYMAELVWIDGTDYAATSFGEFDSDTPTVWKPIDVSGLTFGTNGFYLDFEDSSNLGNDANGGTDFTEANLAATDQATDTPTNNFATGNPLYKNDGVDWSEGNLKNTTGSGEKFAGGSTIKVSNGKWYAEGKHTTASSTNAGCGIYGDEQGASNDDQGVGKHANSYSFQSDAGLFLDANSSSSYGSAFGSGDIIGVYLDLDNNKLYFSKNGVLVSSTGKSITDPASVVDGVYSIAFNGNSASDTATWEINFGGCSAFTISSAVSDDNGYGNFEYSPNITGDSEAKKFYALCTKNLAEFG